MFKTTHLCGWTFVDLAATKQKDRKISVKSLFSIFIKEIISNLSLIIIREEMEAGLPL